MKPWPKPQHHSEQLGETISNPSAFKISLLMVSRGDSNPMFESATSSLVLSPRSELAIRQKQIGDYVALLMDIPRTEVADCRLRKIH
jgi:hypothetical protein